MSDSSNFITQIIDDDLREGRVAGVVTRFPPEPNGYLHIGHAKAICTDFGMAARYGGRCHLRFDDTNPVKEDPKYADAIQDDIRWLGFDWGEHLYWASDYFDQLYAWAQRLVREGKAYVDEQSEAQIREGRGTVESAGVPSPFRDRPAEESLRLLDEMRRGVHPDGAMVLRAKIDMSHPNMKMRDPLMYRIRNVEHPRTGGDWHIYPFYDYAHGLSDAIEGITHSLCSLEFDNNRALYDWFVENLPTPSRPHQYEFARLVMPHTVLSKRWLIRLVEEGHVWGWDDPRMPTIAGLRRRGVRPSAIRAFVDAVGLAKANSSVDPALFEHVIRDDLNAEAPRLMAVLDPLELVVETWPEGEVDLLSASLWPHDVPKEGSRSVPFSRRLFVERADFAEAPPKGWRRLAPGVEVRLRYAYYVTVTAVEKDDAGRVVRLRARHDPESRTGGTPDGRRVKGTIHWVSAEHAVPLTARLFDHLFTAEEPDVAGDLLAQLNPDSVSAVTAMAEPALAEAAPGSHVQLERTGYFFVDPVDTAPGAPVLHRVVALKDSWKKQEARVEAPAEERVPLRLRSSIPEPPPPKVLSPEVEARAASLAARFGLERPEADVIAAQEARVAWFERAASHGPADAVAKLLVHVLIPEAEPDALRFGPKAFGRLAVLSTDGTLSSPLTRRVLSVMVAEGGDPDRIVAAEGLGMIGGDALGALVDAVVAAHPDRVEAYRGGRKGLFGFFMGQVMKQSDGKADPVAAKALLEGALG